MLSVMIAVGLFLFVPAGRIDLPFFWLFMLVCLGFAITCQWLMDPELAKERRKPGSGGQDRNLRLWIAPFFPMHLVVAGLDVGRYHWSSLMPIWLQVAGLLGFMASMCLMVWAIYVNRFFSPVVRIQSERGHHLIADGPYRWVRHPGYTGGISSCACSALLLGSWWSLAPLSMAVFLLIRRTAIEDAYLKQHLPDYANFATKVEFRLIPLIW